MEERGSQKWLILREKNTVVGQKPALKAKMTY